VADPNNQLLFRAFSFPSQLLILETLRRPLESNQYVSIRYSQRPAQASIEPPVGSVGDSYDNALAETLIGFYQTELIHHRGPWRHLEQVEFAPLEWVDWFNHRRPLEPLGYLPPVEFEQRYYQQQRTPVTVPVPN